MKKNKRDLKMSVKITENEGNSAYKTVLDIDEDTSFNISYDTFIYDDNKKYLYIKMEENTALAPFYYHRSYEINELHRINNIFRAVDIEGAKENLKSLFANKKIKLRYEQDMVIMEIDAILFINPVKIEFELYKEMVPQREKDEKLLQLYHIIKTQLKKAKELRKYLKSEQNDMYQQLLDDLSANFDIKDETFSYYNTSSGSNGDEGESCS
jgi:hypothetical protein